MHSGMIGKIDKARRYAEERTRFELQQLSVRVRGDHADHLVTFDDGRWRCECDFFQSQGACAHSMALELVMDGMVRQSAVAAA